MTKPILIIDWETTGLRNWQDEHPAYFKGPQGIQLGAVVCDMHDWSILGEFETDVKWLGNTDTNKGRWPLLEWAHEAYRVHKMSKEHLSIAPEPSEAAELFVDFVREHFNSDRKVRIGGHGVDFDRYFCMQLFYFAGMIKKPPFQIGDSELDTRTVGELVWGTTHSDILFNNVLGEKRNGVHNALDDAKMTAMVFREAFRKVRL